MKHQVSPNRDISIVLTGEEARIIDQHAGNDDFTKYAIVHTVNEIKRIGLLIGCSHSRAFDKVPIFNGIQVSPPWKDYDQAYAVNIRPIINRILIARGEYCARYHPGSPAKLTIKVEDNHAQQPS
jgi:hypothetical protein